MSISKEYQGPGVFIFYIAAFLLLPGFLVPDGIITDLEKNQLKGKVWTVREIRHSEAISKGSQSAVETTYQRISKFNEEGFETEISIINNHGKSSSVEYLFDTAGYKTGLKEYTQDGTLWLTVTYNLDQKGHRVQAIYDWMEKGGYDEIREKSEQLYEVLDRHPWEKVLYKNDYRGMPLEEKYLRADGSLLFKFTYRYDVLGRKTEMNYFNNKGRTSWETKYKYDKQGNLSQSTVFKSNRVASVSEYTYQFDEYGNWVVRTEVRKVNYNILTSNLMEGKFTVERSIEYYP